MKWELPLCISNNLYYNKTEVKRKTIGVTKLLLDDIAKQSDENDRDWQEQMMKLEMRVSQMEVFRAVAFFHHLILIK